MPPWAAAPFLPTPSAPSATAPSQILDTFTRQLKLNGFPYFYLDDQFPSSVRQYYRELLRAL
jgi:hypothetical protein